ncbi:MAG: DNA mismatch repair protein MutS [Lachnospiraceae bacterium]|nr:DNA mismatch repair protein MutS [Lachnospiraceae bacterium]
MKYINNTTINEQAYAQIGFLQIIEQLAGYAVTAEGKAELYKLRPFLEEKELRRQQGITTQARELLEKLGNPPLPAMEHSIEYLDQAERGDYLEPEQIEEFGSFLCALERLKSYLERGRSLQNSLAYYCENINVYTELAEEIQRSIRGKAESALKGAKNYLADSFVVNRNGHICIPVKKQYRNQVAGTVIDTSGAGTTVFMEPASVVKLREELERLHLEEDAEERRILYTIMAEIAEAEPTLREDIKLVIRLDRAFAKGKMSLDMEAVEPAINTEQRICLEQARHPVLKKSACIPLDIVMGNGIRGIVITGPNTGGKTVTIKTVALVCLMACSGLHVPAKHADISMNSQVLCDIGDGQSLHDNLSTFSAHIKNVVEILRRANRESLVILDELGSGTDPAEGMGIAVSILEELRKSGALFLVTTHYPEVKEYAGKHEEIRNASMAFDRESLQPLYRLDMEKAGESCALYIAKRLGVPNEMLRMAAREAYHQKAETFIRELDLEKQDAGLIKEKVPKIKKAEAGKGMVSHGERFTRGDSVTILPEEKIGIVVKPADEEGNVLVQLQKEKLLINHKRLKLKVAATALYPEDYDFSVIFDSVEVRKAHHRMERKYTGETLFLD